MLEALAGVHERLADGLAGGASHHAGGGEQHPAGLVGNLEGQAQALLRLGLRGDRLDGDLHLVLGLELGAAVGAVAFGDLGELVRNQLAQRRIGAEDALQLRDFLLQGIAFCFQLQAGVLGELAQAQLQNVVRLRVGQVEDDLQLFACLSGLIRRTNNLDDLVNIEDRHEQALHQVQAVGALAQAELGAAADHVQAVVNVHAHQVEQAEGLRLTVHERHIVDTEGVLERGVLV